MKRSIVFLLIAGVALSLGAYLLPGRVHAADQRKINGFNIVVPESSIPHPGRIHTNYFLAVPEEPNKTGGPPPGTETPGSLACVYKLVSGPKGCPDRHQHYGSDGWRGEPSPSSMREIIRLQRQTCTPFRAISVSLMRDFQVVYANGHKPPVYSDWEVEEALDIEWAHAMAPKAKLFLVESKLCMSGTCNTDPYWYAVTVASKLVAQNGGGVISMSWGDAEAAYDLKYDKLFTEPGVVYFASSGDSGIGNSLYPTASPNVVSVGGTVFNRDNNGDFVSETHATGGGGGDISPYEPRPSYQDIIKNIVGSKRGYPDVASELLLRRDLSTRSVGRGRRHQLVFSDFRWNC